MSTSALRLHEASEGRLDRELDRGGLEARLRVEPTQLRHGVHELRRPRRPVGTGLAIVLHQWLHGVGVARAPDRDEILGERLG
jgi:hypothetical protein